MSTEVAPETRRAADRIVTALAGVLVGAFLAMGLRDIAEGSGVRWHLVLPFLAAIVVGEVLRVSLPTGRAASPLSTAVVFALALDADYGAGGVLGGVPSVVTLAAAGMLVGAVPYAVAGRTPGIASISRRVLVTGGLAAVFRISVLPALPMAWTSGARFAAVVTVLLTVTVLVDAAMAGAMRSDAVGAPVLRAIRDELAATLGLRSAVAATSALIVLGADVMGAWSLAVFSVPLLIAQFSFKKYTGIRATYLQTIRSLSRATELGGYTETGHSLRVSELAVAAGRELGMSETQLLDLEYAALLHDIGQVALIEPIPGGATVLAAPADQRRIARDTVDIVRETGVLDDVAEILEHQTTPFRQMRELGEEIPLASRILKLVNAYEDLTGGRTMARDREAAIERIHLGLGYEYDPKVVDVLIQVVRPGRS